MKSTVDIIEEKNKSFLNKIRTSKYTRGFSAFVALNLLFTLVFPTSAMALTSGASSPEFSSFEPVATTSMVNEFTGDFTYNLPVISIPGPAGGGYSMSLSYHSGTSAEQEASWVGFGWTLNPGAINRNKRGFVDEYEGVPIIKYNKVKPNWTMASTFNFNIELASNDQKKGDNNDKVKPDKATKLFKFNGLNLNNKQPPSGTKDPGISLGLSFSNSIRYNNYTGFSVVKGFGANIMGMASLNMSRSGGENTYGVSLNPMEFLRRKTAKHAKYQDRAEKTTRKAGKIGVADILKKKSNRNDKITKGASLMSASYSSWTFNAPAVPYSIAKNFGKAYNVSFSLEIDPYGPFGFQVGIAGSMNAQANVPASLSKAYGYMHNPSWDDYDSNPDDGEIEADYQIEKGSVFNKHDKHLGIPFNNADIFTATGNNVMGGFQIHHKQIGHFFAPFIENKQRIRQLGVEVGFGGSISCGTDVGVGFQKMKVKDWRKLDNKERDDINDVAINLKDVSFDNSSTYMRFNGDMGGAILYTGDDLIHATVGGGFFKRKLNLDNIISTNDSQIMQNYAAARSTSYIEYATYNAPSAGSLASLDNILDYTWVDNNLADIYSKNNNYNNLIGQIAVTDKSGSKSTYGLPVFTTEETQLTIGVDNESTPAYTINKTLNFDDPLMNKTVVGSKNGNPYVNTYLLTSTTTFDYVDLTDNGPSVDDFGGWTKFKYTKNANSYRFRAPYTGLFYNRGRLTDPSDATGSMSSGQKEVYYLESIETKTHIAYFITNKTKNSGGGATNPKDNLNKQTSGSNTQRLDGLSAAGIINGKDEAATGIVNTSGNPEMLEKIVLYSKSDFSHPISTTYFEYDQSLCPGIPNTSANPNTQLTGKLTLKKVWTEGGGLAKTRIAPYQFKYEYFRDYTPEMIVDYDLNDIYYGDHDNNSSTPNQQLFDVTSENPNYIPGMLDAWGSYRPNASERFENMQPWLDQTVDYTTENFDPAAWQLKQIILPSGGAIHIQYEQNDYEYVQDKKAMAMTPILNTLHNKNTYVSELGKCRYYIETQSIGLDLYDTSNENLAKIQNYISYLTDYYINKHNKLYFKILYNLDKGIPSINDGYFASDYVSGYTSVNSVNSDATGIYLNLGNEDVEEDKTLPRFLAYKKLLTNSHHTLSNKLQPKNRAGYNDDDMLTAAYNDGDPNVQENQFSNAAILMAAENTFNYFSDWVKGSFGKHKKDDVCKNFVPELSYFKLPVYQAKKGGGVRVKRLLSYDPGIETDPTVYGSEYIYKQANSELSSGVATNEPGSMREENALVSFMERKPQKWLNKVTKGRDSKQFEGPLGESLLPGASVGYSRVVVRNIHTGKTTTGYTESLFHTVKDYPMLVQNSDLKKSNDTYRKRNLSIPLGLFNYDEHKAWVTQGYLFKINDMHGKPKSQATYAGTYSQNSKAIPTAQTTYRYSAPGSAIKSLVYDPSSDKFSVGLMKPGQEEDLTLFRSRVKDRTLDFSTELDLVFTLPYAVSVGFGFSMSLSINELSQHVTSKVLRQKSYLLSTTSTVDGVTQTTKNLAFNKHTGDPVLTSTFDGYGGATEAINTQNDNGTHSAKYYSLNIPASWVYSDLAHKSTDEAKSNQLTANVGSIVTYGNIFDPSTNASSSSSNPLVDFVNNNSIANISGVNFSNVVSASAVVLTNDWFNSTGAYMNADKLSSIENGYNIGSGVKAELNGHYYPLRSYVFKDPEGVKHSEGFLTTNNENIYGGGVAKSNLNMFPWKTNPSTSFNNETVDSKWYSPSRVESFSPNGVALEESNVLNINSTVHFGYGKTLPVLVAQNAKYEQVRFIDYENQNTTSVTSETAHSGLKSKKITGSTTAAIFSNYKFSQEVINKGVVLKLWLKSKLQNGLTNPNPQLKASINGSDFGFNKIAQTGEWSLYEVQITNLNLGSLTVGTYDIDLHYNYIPGEKAYIDDVRIQPLDAVMNCTVYTKDNKVAAQFDDQHFGVFYEYNREGLLVRTSIETERGRKTVKEQQVNIPLQDK